MSNVTVNNYSYPMDGYLKENLDFLKQLPPNDFDAVGLCSGYEGSGKTTLFMQMALYLDPSFTIKNVVFNTEQFSEAVNTLPKGSCILYDEADDSIVSTNWMQEKVKQVISLMKRIRKKNLYILFVTPTFFDMGKYFAVHRARFLIRVYTNGLERGYFEFYNREQIRRLYFKGKKEWDWSVAKHTFRGYFRKNKDSFPIDMDAYEEKKDLASEKIMSKEEGVKVQLGRLRLQIFKRLEKELKLDRKTLARIFDVHIDYISHMRAETDARGTLTSNPQGVGSK